MHTRTHTAPPSPPTHTADGDPSYSHPPPSQERNLSLPNGGPEASRMTATARRKLGTLGTQIDKMLRGVDSVESSHLYVSIPVV